MKQLLTFLTVVIGLAASPVWAQQLPAVPPAEWNVFVRFYGTTDQPGRDDLQISIHTNGKLPARIWARRPAYDDRGNVSLKSPEHKEKLSDEASDAIYAAARSVILNHQIGVEPRELIRDGGSVEITVGSYNRRISAVFDHSGSGDSQKFATLLKTVNSHLPKEFRR